MGAVVSTQITWGVIDKIKTETAVMKRVLSTVESCTDGQGILVFLFVIVWLL